MRGVFPCETNGGATAVSAKTSRQLGRSCSAGGKVGQLFFFNYFNRAKSRWSWSCSRRRRPKSGRLVRGSGAAVAAGWLALNVWLLLFSTITLCHRQRPQRAQPVSEAAQARAPRHLLFVDYEPVEELPLHFVEELQGACVCVWGGGGVSRPAEGLRHLGCCVAFYALRYLLRAASPHIPLCLLRSGT